MEKINTLKTWLMKIGITPNLDGYNYLLSGTMFCLGNNALICAISKRLYPILALYYDKNIASIERNIRHAIQVSCDSNKIFKLNEIAGVVVIEKREKPMASQLISILAENLMMSSI